MHFIERGREVMVVVNHNSETTEDSALLFESLDEEQSDRYRELKNAGLPESTILAELFPEPTIASVAIPHKLNYSDYSKAELAQLISDAFAQRLPSLVRMTKKDLRRICTLLDL